MIDWNGLKRPIILRTAIVILIAIGLGVFFSLLATWNDAAEHEAREKRERREHCYDYQPERGVGCRNRYHTLVVEGDAAICQYSK